MPAALPIPVLFKTALAFFEARKFDQAEPVFHEILRREPANADVLNALGVLNMERATPLAALPFLKAVASLRPDLPHLHFNLGLCLDQLGRPHEAVACYDRAALIAPDDPKLHNNRAKSLLSCGRPQESLAASEAALALRPGYALALNNRGNALQTLGRYAEAVADYARAFEADPGLADAPWNQSLCQLITGDFSRGWQQYEMRWQTPQLKPTRRDFNQPLWLGDHPVHGKTVLLHAEQGFGDTLQFCRYARLVAARGARVILEVQPALRTLMAGLDGVAQVFVSGEVLPPFDFHCPLMSLPLAFRTDLDTIPADTPYLYSSPALVQGWEIRLQKLVAACASASAPAPAPDTASDSAPATASAVAPASIPAANTASLQAPPAKNALENSERLPSDRLRIALVWRGNKAHANDSNRSVPLALFLRLAGHPARFFSLQKDLNDVEATLLRSHPEIVQAGDSLKDFSDTAAVLSHMDLVITADTAVAHLAGAMGKPLWLLLPANPDWRWLIDRSDSPWYPTARLFRQPVYGDWTSVLAQVDTELGRMLAASEPPLPPLPQLLAQALDAHRNGRMAEAKHGYREILARDPLQFDASHMLGVSLMQAGRYMQALAALDQAAAIDARSGNLHYNRGLCLDHLRRGADAVLSYEKAIACDPRNPSYYNNRAKSLIDAGRIAEGLLDCDAALALKPDYDSAHFNRGNALTWLNRLEEAADAYTRTVQLRPDHADALFRLGTTLATLKRHDEAARSFERLLAVRPDYPYAAGHAHFAMMNACDWTSYGTRVAALEQEVARGARADVPFSFLAVTDSPQAQRQCAQVFCADQFPPAVEPVWRGEAYRHDRIRVAYLSADFYEHATSRLMAGVFESHDRRRFELTAISFGPDLRDGLQARVARCFDRFVDVRNLSDRDVARLMRHLEIDIAVDLKGYTRDSRNGILPHRPAPLQVAYLGYPGTSGAPHIDYLIADPHLIPPAQRPWYSEKIISLPDCYQANDSRRAVPPAPPERAALGLPSKGFVFCCFNNNYKITPAVFNVWMRLLAAVEGSVLWLLEDTPRAAANLRKEAEARGIAPERLVFAPRTQPAAHMARQRAADLFLDTLPVNAHTTASDALWAGLPVLTCTGAAFAARVAASLLYAVGLPELVTATLTEYEAQALRLAREPGILAGLQARLEAHRSSHPLFDSERFCRQLESAYMQIEAMRQRGEAPADLRVEPVASAAAPL